MQIHYEQSRFEHKAYAGQKHATAVAKAFQIEAERMATVHLALTKLDALKQFCVEHGIEVPDGKPTKQLMYEWIEEANGLSKTIFVPVCLSRTTSELFYLLY